MQKSVKKNINEIYPITLRCMIANYDEELKNKILSLLENKIKSIHPGPFNLVLDSAKPYWKYPEEMECEFIIYPTTQLFVKDIITILDLECEYQCTPQSKYSIPPHCPYEEEEAIWSKLHHEGVLLESSIQWAQIYLWHYPNRDFRISLRFYIEKCTENIKKFILTNLNAIVSKIQTTATIRQERERVDDENPEITVCSFIVASKNKLHFQEFLTFFPCRFIQDQDSENSAEWSPPNRKKKHLFIHRNVKSVWARARYR